MNSQLLRRAEALRPQPKPPEPAVAPPGDDGRELAAELAAAFGQLLEQYRELFPQSEADKQALAKAPDERDRVLHGPPDQVSWFDLEKLARKEPDRAKARWQEIKEAARSELRTGHRAAQGLEVYGQDCWVRARFLGLRTALHEAWQPRNELEMNLLDQMAQFETLRQHWCETLVVHTAQSHLQARRAQKDEAVYERPAQTAAQAIAGATRMVETCQRLYLRALRALMALRRGPALIVRSAQQVNLGEQQVNFCGGW
jgi:hypothetical protein